MIQLKRAYAKPGSRDGFRVLVERLWPRGVSKREAAIDSWLKEAAPSTELRSGSAMIPASGRIPPPLSKRAAQKKDLLAMLRDRSKREPVTFVYAARDEEHNGALVLKEFLETGK